jgi:hypothetical protein
MPDRETVNAPPLDYDPEVRDRIHDLLERMRATSDPEEIGRLEDQLDQIIFSSTIT